MMQAPTVAEREFLPENFDFKTWKELQPYFDELDQRQLQSAADTRKWLRQVSELEAYFIENMAWRYIRMSTDTKSEQRREAYNFFIREVQPKAAPYFNRFNHKLMAAPGKRELEQEPGFDILYRNTQKAIEIYREENIDLAAEMVSRSQEYGATVGEMSIELDGKEYTMPQAFVLLESPDFNLRKKAFQKIADRRMAEEEKLNKLMDDLVDIRHKMAVNAGYANYRDYKFDELNRFDYSPENCFNFHNSIANEVVPVMNRFDEERKSAMGLSKLKPFDFYVDFRGEKALRPFGDADEMRDQGVKVLSRVHPFFGQCLETMHKKGHLDLETRSGKSPGGYNYPLYESGYPFIFMNAAGSQTDWATFIHESGHAVHAVLCQELELTQFKDCPSEVAELASMSMELLSMDHWDVVYSDPAELRRAKLGHLESSLRSLAWIATVDSFQHWLYENPGHSREERVTAWRDIYTRFQPTVDWTGFEKYRDNYWHRQLHLFDVPFYYIEYGMAQLGALAVWRNYKLNPEKALQQYIDALYLGNTRSIPEVYAAAGISFDFSSEYIRELIDFVVGELKQI